MQQTVFVLHAHEPGRRGARGALGRAELIDGEVGAADLAHPACLHEPIERFERVRDRRLGVGLVQLVEIDAIRAEPAQAVLEAPADVLRLGAAPMLVHPELGG